MKAGNRARFSRDAMVRTRSFTTVTRKSLIAGAGRPPTETPKAVSRECDVGPTGTKPRLNRSISRPRKSQLLALSPKPESGGSPAAAHQDGGGRSLLTHSEAAGLVTANSSVSAADLLASLARAAGVIKPSASATQQAELCQVVSSV